VRPSRTIPTCSTRSGKRTRASAVVLALVLGTRAAAAGGVPVIRGSYGKDASASGFDHIVRAGFTAIDRGAFPETLDPLPPGVKAFVWLGNWDNKTCAWEKSDDWIRSHLGKIVGHRAILAYNLADEPHLWDCPNVPAALKARTRLVRSLDPKALTFVVIEPHSPGNPYAEYVGTVDVIAADGYPCSHKNGCVMTKIDDQIRLLEEAHVPRYWGVVQAFADSWYRMPTAEELREEFRRWRSSRMEGWLVFSWTYGTDTLERHADLVDVLRAENGR
jgi:hypothetical protein